MVKITEKEGVIFKIKRFSIHDGPGIRTSVFLKGCPLNCIWCHSPEGISKDISIWYNCNLCIGCGKCVQVCPEKALKLVSGTKHYIHINREYCNISGNCVSICPTNSIQFTGSVTNISMIMDEVEKDMLYLETSGGGVTLTGGEPLFQPEFSAGILKACRIRKIHTAIETSLFCERNVIDLVSEYVDLFIIDLKVFDSRSHRIYTGKGNELIIDNFRYLANQEKDILVRIPLIDKITNTELNLSAVTNFVKETRSDIQIEKIGFNPLAGNNYEKLGIPFLIK